MLTLESIIDVGQGINVGSGKLVKNDKRRALNKRRAWKSQKEWMNNFKISVAHVKKEIKNNKHRAFNRA